MAHRLDVRLVPELCIAALKTKQDKELAMWCCLRAINHWGSGGLHEREAMDCLKQTFNYSERTIWRTLSSGEGVFWHRKAGKRARVVEIQGIKVLAEILGVRLSRFYVIPGNQFSTLKRRRAWMYAVFHSCNGGPYTKPVSRQSIAEATGLNRRRQQRYDNTVGIIKKENYAFIQEGDKYIPIKVEVAGKSRLFTINRQLGNTYHCPAIYTVKGMCKGIRRAIESYREGEASIAKRFFYSTRKLLRTPDRASEAFLAIADRQSRLPRSVRGEWCLA